MASLFRARSSEENRSGGKIVRGRRATPSASPYLRPPLPLPSPSPAQSLCPRWLSGLIAGTGKLISAVFPAKDISSSSSSSTYSSDEDIGSGQNEDKDDSPPRELHESIQRGEKSQRVRGFMEEPLAIVPISESKLAIEKLLMQETFSRDECTKLTKLIQSRVVDLPSAELCKDGTLDPNRTTGSDSAFSGALRSLKQNRKLFETTPISASKMSTFSPGSYAHEVCKPDLCNKAVMEAKKWFEEKKIAPSSKCDLECGSCTLNTDMLQYDIEGEASSPVDLAKSYMESLPPWKSPSLSRIGFMTPPPSRMHLYKEGNPYATTNHSLPSSKIRKRDYLEIGSWDTFDEIRRVRLKSTDNKLDMSKPKQIESSARLLEHESSKSSSEPDKRELYVEDHSNLVSNGPEVEEVVNPMPLTLETPLSITQPLEPAQSDIRSELQPSNTDMLILEENQHVEEPSQTEEHVDSAFVPHDSLVLTPMVGNHDGDPLSEADKMTPENIKTAAPNDTGDVTNLNDVHTSKIQTSSGVEALSQLNVVSDSRLQNLNPQKRNEGNGSANKITNNCSPADLNTNSDHENLTRGGTSPTNSSNAESAAGISETIGEPSNEAAMDTAPIIQGTSTGKSQNGTRMKSIERMLTVPQPSTGRRGRKAVAKTRRGRKG